MTAHCQPFSPKSDEAGSSGAAGGPNLSSAVELISSDDLTGIAQPDVQHHQETWVRYSPVQEAQPVACWRQQDSLMTQTNPSFPRPHGSHRMQANDPALPVSASLAVIQAPAAFARPIVQKKTFKPPFVLRMELRHKGHLDVSVTVTVSVINDAQYSKPSSWQPVTTSGQPDLEAYTITRQIQVSSPYSAQHDSMAGRDSTPAHTQIEDFEFTELLFVKSSRMGKRWLIFSCFFKEELLYVLYKLPTVIISRRTDQYSKAYESLMGQQPLQGPPFRSKAPQNQPRVPTLAPNPPIMVQHTTPAVIHSQPDRLQRAPSFDAADHIDERHVTSWVLRTYNSMGFRRALTDADLAALHRQLAAGQGHREKSPALASPAQWEDFKWWFSKCVRALKQCEQEWNQVEPTCMCGFAMDREGAEALLQYHPPGAFLVRICQEPGSFSISCRVNPQPANDADVEAGSEHLMVDCLDLQSQALWQWVRAWPPATHLVDLHTHQLHPKEQLFVGQGTRASGHSAAGSTEPADIDQILLQAARQLSQAAGHRPASSYPSAIYGSTAVPSDVTGHAAYQHAAPAQPGLPSHALDSPHWGWTAGRAPGKAPRQGQGQGQEQGQGYGPSDSGVAALLASLKSQVVGSHQHQGGPPQGGQGHRALPSRVLDGQHRRGSLQEGQQEQLQQRQEDWQHAQQQQQQQTTKHQAASQH